jgi:isopentenyl-diphosphate delta-isomerase
MLMKIFGMLINNKYFNQKIVFDQSPLLRSLVVLCDKRGKELGTYDKLKAHKEGKMHKTFSVFIYNGKGEHLVQKRSTSQPHSVGLWSNTYSFHCISGEKLLVTAQRKILEDLGIETTLEKRFSFPYKIHTDAGLTEQVYDTVLIGKYDGEVKLNSKQFEEARWMNIEDLANDIKINPRTYTDWFKIILERMGYRD